MAFKGQYVFTWLPSHSAAPAWVNNGVAFSGWANFETALQESVKVQSSLSGNKWISLGGGNENGKFTLGNLSDINSAVLNGRFSGWYGIVFDVEEGDAGLADSFHKCFQSCQAMHLQVLVTVSHSAPYGISDAATLMTSFFQDHNINYLSPQLYTSGTESDNDFTISQGVEWSAYVGAAPIVAPSIVTAALYDDASKYFQKLGVTTGGFVQWSQTN